MKHTSERLTILQPILIKKNFDVLQGETLKGNKINLGEIDTFIREEAAKQKPPITYEEYLQRPELAKYREDKNDLEIDIKISMLKESIDTDIYYNKIRDELIRKYYPNRINRTQRKAVAKISEMMLNEKIFSVTGVLQHPIFIDDKTRKKYKSIISHINKTRFMRNDLQSELMTLQSDFANNLDDRVSAVTLLDEYILNANFPPGIKSNISILRMEKRMKYGVQGIKGILADQSLDQIPEVIKHWPNDLGVKFIKEEIIPEDTEGNKEELIATELMKLQSTICRKLYFAGKEVTTENITKQYELLQDQITASKKVDIFKGRQIVYLAHSEINSMGDHNFGKEGLLDGIKDKEGILPDDSFLRPEENNDSIARIKAQALEKIRTTAPPMTFIFEGHGLPNGLYLSDGQTIAQQGSVAEDLFISPKEFAAAIIARSKNFPDSIPKQMPIFTTMAEYGQSGVFTPADPLSSEFMQNSLDLDSDDPTMLSNLVYQDSNMSQNNPTTYIPNLEEGQDLAKSDIFIIHDCYGSNFIRSVMDILKKTEGFGGFTQLAQNAGAMPDSMVG